MSEYPGKIRRSDGPRTPKGKAAAALNAIKSGAYSQNIRLDTEDIESFEMMRDAVFSDLAPQTNLQGLLANDVFKYLWMKSRLQDYDTATLDQLFAKPLELTEWVLEIGLNYESVAHKTSLLDDGVREKGVEHFEYIFQLSDELKKLYPGSCPDVEAFKRDHSDAYELLKSRYADPHLFDQKIKANEKTIYGTTFWEGSFSRLKDWAKVFIDAFRAEEQLAQADKRARTKRVYRYLTSETSQRAADDLSRALNRAMTDYHREKDRYQKELFVKSDLEGHTSGQKSRSKKASAERVTPQEPPDR